MTKQINSQYKSYKSLKIKNYKIQKFKTNNKYTKTQVCNRMIKKSFKKLKTNKKFSIILRKTQIRKRMIRICLYNNKILFSNSSKNKSNR